MNVQWPVVGVPFCAWDKVAFRIGRRPGWWVEAGLVGGAGVDRRLHFVVDGEDGIFGDVGAFGGDFALVVEDFGALDVFAFDDGECFHDVFDGVARRGEHPAELSAIGSPFTRRTQIKMEVGCIQLAPHQKPTLLIPTKRRARVIAVQCERFQVPCGVRQFENASDYT